MNKKIALAASCLLGMAAVGAQSPEPKPAFEGQTDAPAPATPSPPVDIKVVADGLTGAWAMAFLPDGNFLVTQSAGTMRIVRPDGVVSGPLAGVPDVKSVAAQGLHDVVLDRSLRPIDCCTSHTSLLPRARRRPSGLSSSSTSASGPSHWPSGERCSLGPSGWRAHG